MITKWGLTNFKSIYDADIELAPLTVLTGTNSSGKSSFIQSILLIAQTLRNSNHYCALALNGNYVNLGQFNDIRSFYQNDNGERQYTSVYIRFTCEYATDGNYFHLYGFHNVKKEEYYHKINFAIEFDAAGKDELLFHKEQLSPRIKSIEQLMNVTDKSGAIKSMNITIPDTENKYNDPSIDMPFYHFWVGFEIDKNFNPMYYHIFESYFGTRFTYLAPLRHHGTMYPLSKSSNYSDIGLNGEYTAAVLDSHALICVSYIPVHECPK